MKKHLQKYYFEIGTAFLFVFVVIISLFLKVITANAADIMAVRDLRAYNEIILIRAPESWSWMTREIAGDLQGFSTAENPVLFRTSGYAQTPPKINNLYFKKRLGCCSDDIVFFIDIKKISDCCRYTAAIYVVPNRPATDFFKFVAPASFTNKSFSGIKSEIMQYISQILSIKEGDWSEGRHCFSSEPKLCRKNCINISIDNSHTTIIDPMNYQYPYPPTLH